MASRLVVCGLAASIAACAQPAGVGPEVLEARLAAMQADNQTLAERVAELEHQSGLLKLSDHTHKGFAEIKPADPGWAFVQTHNFPAVLMFESIVPSGGGSSVSILVGNPNAVTFRNAELTIFAFRGAGATEAEQAAVQSRYEHRGDLLPGQWTRVTFPVHGIKPEDFDRANVVIAFERIDFL